MPPSNPAPPLMKKALWSVTKITSLTTAAKNGSVESKIQETANAILFSIGELDALGEEGEKMGVRIMPKPELEVEKKALKNKILA